MGLYRGQLIVFTIRLTLFRCIFPTVACWPRQLLPYRVARSIEHIYTFDMTKESFQRRGVVFPVPALDGKQVNHVLAGLFRYVSHQRSRGKELDASPFDGAQHPLVELLMPVVRERRFLKAIRPYLGDTILLRSINVFSKYPTGVGGTNASGPTEKGSHYPIQWHWDDPRPGSDCDDVLTAWIALTPSTVDSGCVRYVEGSHRVSIPRSNPLDRNDMQLEESEWHLLDGLPIVDAILQPGEMALHHSAIVHGSAPNYAEQPRVGLAVRLYTPRSPESVTGTRIGVLLSGQVPEAVDSQRTEGLQLREMVNCSWWKGSGAGTQQGEQTPAFNRKEADQKLVASLEARGQSGDAAAMYLLGRIRLVGLCETESDPEEAIRLFEAAAEGGEQRAVAFQDACAEEEQSQVLLRLREESKGLSTLAWLCFMGDEQSVRFVLDEGLPVNLRLRDGRQALHVAASRAPATIVEVLLERGADIDSPGPGGATPLHLAVQSGNGSAVRALLRGGADASQCDGTGNPPHHGASDAIASLFTESSPP